MYRFCFMVLVSCLEDFRKQLTQITIRQVFGDKVIGRLEIGGREHHLVSGIGLDAAQVAADISGADESQLRFGSSCRAAGEGQG
jgi:hypothetical protein